MLGAGVSLTAAVVSRHLPLWSQPWSPVSPGAPEADRTIGDRWRTGTSSARPPGNLPVSTLQDNFISLDIEDGNLMVRYKLNSELPKEKGFQDTINNGRDHTVRTSLESVDLKF